MDAGGTEDGAEARCPVNHLLVGTSEPRGDVVEGPHGGAAMSWRDRRRCEALTLPRTGHTGCLIVFVLWIRYER